MDLSRFPRDTEPKNHDLFGDELFAAEPPRTTYEKRPLTDPDGNVVDGLYTAWIALDNPRQFNSYTTTMVKGVIAGFHRASMARDVVAVVFTGTGDRAFCAGGNTEEYATYYSANPQEYGSYIDLFAAMVDAIINCKKPVICRVNGMRIAGGQEIGTACDFSISSDMAQFGQAGPRHGSSPEGGSTDFLPWFLSIEQAMWSGVTCELWSAYKMYRLGLITKAVPVLKVDGKFVRNPLVVTDRYVDDGDIVYGEPATGSTLAAGKQALKAGTTDFSLLDAEVEKTVWMLTNLMPGCTIKAIDSIRGKKKYFWDLNKTTNRHWLGTNMMSEAYAGFNAFNSQKETGSRTVDFIKYRQLLAEGHPFDSELIDRIMYPKKG